MFLLRLKEIRGLSVKMADKEILSSEILANKGDSKVFSSVSLLRAQLEVAVWNAEAQVFVVLSNSQHGFRPNH